MSALLETTTKKMNKEKQRIAISEACGWALNAAKHSAGCLDWINERTGETAYSPPDYLNDLNAMHEAEKVLLSRDADIFERYLKEILEVVDLGGGYYLCATAAQRAEAFLRTIGKWEDGE